MDRQMKRAATIAAMLTLAACAGTSGHWDHAHKDPTQFQRDAAQCTYEAAAATGSAPASFSLGQNISQDIATGLRRGELEQLCMRARGYYFVPQ